MNTASESSQIFANNLERLKQAGDRQTLAELRRFADGRPPSLSALSAIAKLGAPLDDPQGLSDCQLVAGLFAFYNRGTTPEEHPRGDFGWSFGSLAVANLDSKGPQRLFGVLLEARREDLAEQLRRAISLLHAKGIPVDWALLLDAVKRWGNFDHVIQDSWALSFVRLTNKKEVI